MLAIKSTVTSPYQQKLNQFFQQKKKNQGRLKLFFGATTWLFFFLFFLRIYENGLVDHIDLES